MYQNVSSAPAYSAEVLGCLIFPNQEVKGISYKKEKPNQKIKK